jgi:uncharacterized OB-fold protein
MTQSVEAPRKPVPQPDDVSRPFFEGALRGELMIQQCDACKAFLAPGSRLCTECLNESLTWTKASGKATLFTFAVMHQKYHFRRRAGSGTILGMIRKLSAVSRQPSGGTTCSGVKPSLLSSFTRWWMADR